MKYLKIICVLLLVCTAKPANAQTEGRITGKIADTRQRPVAYATVTLLRTDSTVVNGNITEEDGSFTISPTGMGSFLIRINIIGYDPHFAGPFSVTAVRPEINTGRIILQASTQMLSEVTVVGEKSMMEMSVDKKVFNVEKDLSATGGTATDVLKNIPSLSVDVDGDVSLRGKTATILIDGKPATLLGSDVNAALQSLSSSGIQSVEVITNPSAKFDAQGMTGIINIITRKDRKFGKNGSISVGAGTGDKYNAALNLNLRNERWNFFLNSSFRRNRSYQRGYNERQTLTGQYTNGSYEDEIRIRGGWFTSFGAEYRISERHTIGLTQNLNDMRWGGNGGVNYYRFRNGIRDSFEQRQSKRLGTPLSSSTSLDYKHNFKKPQQELTANVTFAHTWSKHDREYLTSFYTPAETAYKTSILQLSPTSGYSSSLNAQADYSSPFLFPDGKIEAGWKSQLYWFESANNATIDSGQGPQPDLLLQNDFKYAQHIHAAYASFSDKRQRLSYQAGLRMEYSKYEGTSSLVGGQSYTNEFLNLFPSAFLSYDLGKNREVYLNYTRRTNRPSFFRLMPYIDVSDPQDTSSGNPDLKPEFIHNTELSFSSRSQKGHTLIGSLYYQYTENMIDRIRRFNNQTGNSFSRHENLHSGMTYGIEFTGRFQLLPIWDATFNANFFRNELSGGNNISTALNNTGTSWFLKMNSSIRLPEEFSIQVNANYDAPKIAPQGNVHEVYWVDLAVRKNLFDGKANIVLNISDLLNTRKYTTVYDLPAATQTRYRDRETRIAQFTFTYRFGRTETKSASRRNKAEKVPLKDRNTIGDQDGDQGGF